MSLVVLNVSLKIYVPLNILRVGDPVRAQKATPKAKEGSLQNSLSRCWIWVSGAVQRGVKVLDSEEAPIEEAPPLATACPKIFVSLEYTQIQLAGTSSHKRCPSLEYCRYHLPVSRVAPPL